MATVAAELEIELLQAENVNEQGALERIRAARPEAIAVCAFGQLIREPLLSEWPLLNVHPSLLPRWRGAAPIERAIMAGDARTGVSLMRLTAGLDSGPVALREEIAIGPEDDFASLSGKLSALGGELLVEALDRQAEGTLTFAEQDDEEATYAEKIDSAERRLDPGRPALRAGAHGPRPDPPHRRLSRAGRRGAARRQARARGRRRRQAGRVEGRVGGAAARLRARRAAAGGRAAARRQADARRRLPARPRGARALIAPARALAFETVRATFEQDAHTERFFREAADGRELDGRERAQAQRLAFGAVQRRGTADAAIERLAERSLRLLDPPVLAALRLGLYELLFADGTPDHAAVDQAVELVKSAGRGPCGRAGQRRAPPCRRANGRS